MTNLQTRILSALVMGVAALWLAWMGGLPFRALAAAMAVLIALEWTAMLSSADRSGGPVIGWPRGAVVLATAIVGIALCLGLPAAPLWGLVFVTVVAVGVTAGLGRGRIGWMAGGALYACGPALAIALLRGDTAHGMIAIVFVFAVVWATDIMAYFSGKAIGGPKLAPSISPGKTRSGAIGGALSGALAGVIVALAAGLDRPLMLGLLALLLSAVSQAGDLFESWVKRRHGVKDSGRIIPGHGGVMDRLDGLVAAAATLYLIGSLVSGPDDPARGLFGAGALAAGQAAG